MILLIDVGNTNVTIGACENDKIIASWRMTTNKDQTSDEIGVTLRNFFTYNGIDIKKIKGTIISSVVPPIMYSLTHAVRKYIGTEPIVVKSTSKMGLTVKYDNPKEVGADRLVNAVAAIKKYPLPLIIVDFGTIINQKSRLENESADIIDLYKNGSNIEEIKSNDDHR